MTEKKSYPCFCCGYLTLGSESSGSFDICPICLWEDDNVQARDPDFPSGANSMSLTQARANFARYGAKSPGHVGRARKPLPEEIPPSLASETPNDN